MSEKTPSGYHIEHLRAFLGDRFELRNEIGSGAFATVYLARNLRLGRMEALKVLFDRGDRGFGRRFAEEVKLVASLDHPNIVKVYDHGQAEGFIWCSMQLIDGPTLRDELEIRQRFETNEMVRLMIPLLDALAYSHEAGTVHRDVKPSNIILDRRGRPFLMDFGIAKSVQNARQTMTGGILGTPTYISPEQLSKKELDGRADLYALGVTMYEMLTGRPPFVGEDVVQTVVKRLMEDPEPLSIHLPSVDPRLEAIVLRALEREPEQRFADATRMREDLIEVVGSDWRKIAWPLPKVGGTLGDGSGRGPETGDEVTTVMENPSASGSRRPGPVVYGGALLLGVMLLWAGWFLAGRLTQEPPPNAGRQMEQPAEDGPEPLEARQPQAAGDDESVDTPSEADLPEVVAQVVEPPPAPVRDESSPAQSAPPDSDSDNDGPGGREKDVPNPAEEPGPPAPVPRRAPAPEPEEIVLRPAVPPRLRSTVEPVLSPEAVQKCVGVAVVLTVQVNAAGAVERTRVLRGDDPACDRAAEAAAAQYEFEPARSADGQALSSSTTISVRFTESHL